MSSPYKRGDLPDDFNPRRRPSPIASTPDCVICQEPHQLHECWVFNDLPWPIRIEIVIANKLCRSCLEDHTPEGNCSRRNVPCHVLGCPSRHHPLTHCGPTERLINAQAANSARTASTERGIRASPISPRAALNSAVDNLVSDSIKLADRQRQISTDQDSSSASLPQPEYVPNPTAKNVKCASSQPQPAEPEPKCTLCHQNKHSDYSFCPVFRKNGLVEREKITAQLTLCFRCLKEGHRPVDCPRIACGIQGCRVSHNPLLHRIHYNDQEDIMSNIRTHMRAKNFHLARHGQKNPICGLCTETGHHAQNCHVWEPENKIQQCKGTACCTKCLLPMSERHKCPCEEIVCGVDSCTAHHHPFLHPTESSGPPEPERTTERKAWREFRPNQTTKLPGRSNYLSMQNLILEYRGQPQPCVILLKDDLSHLLLQLQAAHINVPNSRVKAKRD